MDNKMLFGIFINIFIIAIVIGFVIVPNIHMENDDSNITLIKLETKGHVSVDDKNNSDPYYYFYVNGVLKNLPANVEGYDLKAYYYGNNNELLHVDDGDIKWVARGSEKSEPSVIGCWRTQDPKNVSTVEINVINPDGVVVFNQTVNFDMNRFDYSGLHKSN